MIGEVIGNFRVTSKLGAGGMGEVYLAEQRSIDTKVAVKVLRPEISSDHAQVERFFNEARAVSRIKHAGTVKIFDVGFHTTGHAYLIMEFLEGETLAARIHRLGKLALAAICDIGKQTAGVLEATHAAGITHRDLKPENIYLVPDAELASRERVKILDFGIAKLSGNTGMGPKTVGTMGTPAYMAPEQWGDSAKVDWRADIYSLGCVTFEMAAGRPPFLATNFAEACAAHLQQTPPKLRTVVPDLPEPLEAIIDAMLAKSPYSRPPLRDVARTLEQLGIEVAGVFADTLKPAFRPRAGSSAESSGALAPLRPTPVPAPVSATMPIGPTVASSPGIPRSDASSSMPKPRASSPVPEAPAQTTLSASAAVISEAPKKSRAPIYAIGGLVVVGGGIAAIVAATSGGGGKALPDAKVAIVDAPIQTPVVDPPAPPAPPAPKRKRPPFLELSGVTLMPQQATRREYADYLVAIGGDVAKLRPLDDWNADAGRDSDPRADDPVAWVTFEHAKAFCAELGARLLTGKEWLQVAKGTWHVGGADRIVLRDWTSTVTDGLAEVYGGHSMMANDGERARAAKNPLSKPIDSGVKESIADRAIGIRCAKGESKAPAPGPVPKPDGPRARAAVTLGQPTSMGDLDKAVIHRYLERQLAKIQYCYEKELLAKPTLAGVVQVQFLITGNGSVSAANARGVDPIVAACVAAVIQTIEFPKPKGGGNVQVNFPFIMRADGG